MKLIIGLGNPGSKYKDTRHNFGRRAVELLAKKHGAKFANSKKYESKTATMKYGRTDLVYVLIQSFMNESGPELVKLFKSFDQGTPDFIIAHDDLDLPFGTIRISKNLSSGGHKGVQSVIDSIGSNDFVRVRLGIGPKTSDAETFVLEKWTREEH